MKQEIVVVVALLVAQARAAGFPTEAPSLATLPSTSTSDSSSSTALPIFIFGEPSPLNIDTCDSPLTISWSYSGATPLINFTLSATNINVTQFPPPPSNTGGIVTGRQIIPSIASGSVISTSTVSTSPGSPTPLAGLIESLTTSLDPLAQSSFTWTQANLPQGWYQILATPTDAGDVMGVGSIWSTFQESSTSFFIQNGSDVSCLAAIGTATSSSSSDANSATSETATSSAAASTNGVVSSFGSTAQGNRGAIAGGIVGGVAILVAVLCVCLVYRQGRRSTFPKNRTNLNGQWGPLGSFDSTDFPSRPKSSVDTVTAKNTAANSHSRKRGGSGFGEIGLAALGSAKLPDKVASPFVFTAKSKRNFNSPHSSAGNMMGSSGLYASLGHGQTSMSTSEIEEEFAYFLHEEDIPMHRLSPTTPSTKEGHQTDQRNRSYNMSSDSLGSGVSGVGGMPTAYHSSPFDTPPPSQSPSRHSSRSYMKTSLPGSSSIQTIAAFEHSDLTSSDNRVQAQSQHDSSPSQRAPDSPDSPTRKTLPGPFIHHQKRASSPDTPVYHQITEGSQNGSSSKAKRTPRKPVPLYSPQDEISPTIAPVSPVYTFHSSNNSNKPMKAGPVRRAAPAPPSESASSSSSSQRFHPPQPFLHSLEHKESAHSLASLRSMEGDLSGYGGVGKDGVKQMHVLIPDMPLSQSD